MKKLYFFITAMLFLTVGCSNYAESMDSGDTQHRTEQITSVVTEMVTEPETTEITEQTEPVDPIYDSSVPCELSVIVQSAPDSTAPLRFIARMDKAEYTQDEPIIIRTTLINNGEPFTTNICTYFAGCKLIRDLDDGEYEELMVDIPIPEGIINQEIANGQASEEKAFCFWYENHSLIVQRKSADGTVLDKYRISSLETGVYHLLLYYQNHLIPQAEYCELYSNCITVK